MPTGTVHAPWARGVAVCIALTVAGTGCGSADNAPKIASVPVVATTAAPHVEPCGAGTPAPSDEIGISGDTITVGVVADVTGIRAQFVPSWQAMQAFAAFCNSQGGIAGRRLEVRLFDTNVFNHRAAISDSCASVFALVGSASAFDGDGSSIESDCGIPDVPAFVAEPAHERVATVVSPLPSPSNLFLIGPQRYLAEQEPAAVRRAGMAFLNIGVTAVRATRQLEASRSIGYRFTSVDPLPALYDSADIDGLVARIAKRKVGYLSVQGRVADLATIQVALAARQSMPGVVDAGPLAYDPSYLQAAGPAAEGTYVLTQTAPFTDVAIAPELQRYVEWLDRAVPGATPTALGARSWSAALLFAEATRRAASHLDRSTLLRELRTIHAWDGNGIQVPADPGSGLTSACFAYLRVRAADFRRAYPASGFACPRDGWLRLPRDFRRL